MDKIDFEKQILSTNDWGLLAILNEGLIDKIEECKLAIGEKNYGKLNELNNVLRDILTELIITFKEPSQIAMDLREIYLFINKLTTKGEYKRDIECFNQAKDIIEPILEAFREKEISEVGKIVSGLTYGKGQLKESETSSGIEFKG